MNFKTLTHSVAETQAAAREFSATLRPGTVVALTGTLGSGKTTFAKGIITAMHSGGSRFQGSPTYTLVQEYHTGQPAVYHFDFYRIKNIEEIYDIGWDDYCTAGGIVLVEWADRFPAVLPIETRWLKLEIRDMASRAIWEDKNSSS